MLPDLTSANLSDQFSAYSESISDDLVCSDVMANCQDLIFGEFSLGKSGAAGNSLPGDGIIMVFLFRPCSQMRGLDTDGPVTGVQNIGLFFGDWIVRVKDAVGNLVGTRHRHFAIQKHAKMAVSSSVCRGGPVPALISRRRITGHKPLECLFFRESPGPIGSHHDLLCCRVAMPAPARVMCVTPTSSKGGPITLGNRVLHHSIIGEI